MRKFVKIDSYKLITPYIEYKRKSFRRRTEALNAKHLNAFKPRTLAAVDVQSEVAEGTRIASKPLRLNDNG